MVGRQSQIGRPELQYVSYTVLQYGIPGEVVPFVVTDAQVRSHKVPQTELQEQSYHAALEVRIDIYYCSSILWI
jgi:hypothetical protein